MGVKRLDPQVLYAATTFEFSSGLRQTGIVVPRSRYAFVPYAPRNNIYGQPGGCKVVGFETREACANLSGVMMGRLVPAPR